MMRKGHVRRWAAEVLYEMRQSPERSVRDILDDLLYNALVSDKGEAEAKKIREEGSRWRKRIVDVSERSYIVWLASAAFAATEEVDKLLARRCCEFLVNTGRGASIDVSVLRASMRAVDPDAVVTVIFRADREVRLWAEAFNDALENNVIDPDDPRIPVILGALADGLLIDIGCVELDLLRVVVAESIRGGSRALVTRHQARSWALQLLYQLDLTSFERSPTLMEDFWFQQLCEELGTSTADCVRRWVSGWSAVVAGDNFREFTSMLLQGVLDNRDEIDAKISAAAENWEFLRIGCIERSVLRLAVFEMAIHRDVPPIVCINEAIELAKEFSPEDCSRFVNGVLDRIRKDVVN